MVDCRHFLDQSCVDTSGDRTPVVRSSIEPKEGHCKQAIREGLENSVCPVAKNGGCLYPNLRTKVTKL